MKARVLFPLASILLAACATPPGQIPDSAFGWHVITVDGPPAQAFRSVMERDRRCGRFAGTIPDGQFYPDTTQQRIDLFVPQAFGHFSSGIVGGRVDISSDGNRTRVRVGIRTIFGGEPRATDASRYIENPSLDCDA